MSFRFFVWWCTVYGGWAALVSWGVGRLIAGNDPLGSAGIKGLCLGALIALALGTIDALWVLSYRQMRRIVPRVAVCVAFGAAGGLYGEVAGQLLHDRNSLPLFLGWGLTGLLAGASIGTFDFLRDWVIGEETAGARGKVIRGMLGGLFGGMLGGLINVLLPDRWSGLFPGRSDLWSPSATGFAALGVCIGLWIGVAQVVLHKAWLRVEAGYHEGRDIVIAKTPMTIGQDESCDLGLFDDNTVNRFHARILREGGRFLIEDSGGAGGTWVNDVLIDQPTPLYSGDVIGVGNARVRFMAREKETE